MFAIGFLGATILLLFVFGKIIKTYEERYKETFENLMEYLKKQDRERK